jgi:hypothetical protein
MGLDRSLNVMGNWWHDDLAHCPAQGNQLKKRTVRSCFVTSAIKRNFV